MIPGSKAMNPVQAYLRRACGSAAHGAIRYHGALKYLLAPASLYNGINNVNIQEDNPCQ